ncbi:MAG TPA: hypothetical protein PKV41_03580 [Candidatus Omnitrophota bacterium]|nr:hypothetical protein [Candidatus Omnitrophota bacterium]
MKRKALSFALILIMAGAVAAQEQMPFVYDDGGKRDPLWPLVNANGAILNYESEFLITDLSLEGIMAGAQGENFAIINGRILKTGDAVGQFVVGGIAEDSIILKKGKQKFELKLKKGE